MTPSAIHLTRSIHPKVGGPSTSIGATIKHLQGYSEYSSKLILCGPDNRSDPHLAAYAKDSIDCFKPYDGRLFRSVLDADILHVHGLWRFFSNLSAIRLLIGRPVIFTTHGMLSEPALQVRGLAKRLLTPIWERPKLNSSACMRALNELELRDMRSYGITGPIAVIPNGVDELPPMDRNTAHSMLRLDPTRRYCLYIGRLNATKGIPELLEAWRALPASTWTLLLAGPIEEGYARNFSFQAQPMIDDGSVIHLGLVSGPLKVATFRSANAFVLPSRFEGMSMSILEALSAALPVVITDRCNFPQVAQYDLGIVCDTGARSIGLAINRLISMTDVERQEIGERGLALVREKYSWRFVCDLLISLNNWVLGSRGSGFPGELK